jgi:hypothetical protein
MEISYYLVTLIYAGILVAALCLVIFNFICDNQTCLAFKNAETEGEKGSKDYNDALLSELFTDGIWPFAYIAATISSALALWLIRDECVSIKKFTILFLVTFICIYLMLAFIAHHYVEPIVNYLYKENRMIKKLEDSSKISKLEEEDLLHLFETYFLKNV